VANRSTPRSRAAARYALAVSHVIHSSPAARRSRNAKARAAAAARFVVAADPNGDLIPAERERRAGLIRSGWMTHLSWSRVAGRKPMTLDAWLAKYARIDAEAGVGS